MSNNENVKLGVLLDDETDASKKAELDSERHCKNCLKRLNQNTNVKSCPNCGTEPFETP